MKAIIKLFLVLFAVITCLGCEKANEEQATNSEGTSDVYYVKFEAESSYYYIHSISISLTGCDNFYTKVDGKTYSEIIGPAHKGAVATMRVAMSSGTCDNTSIYVSKNNGPFALKKRGSGDLSYTIDF